MKIEFNPTVISGGAMLSAATVIKNIVPYEWGWYIACIFAVIGPILMCLTVKKKNGK